MEKKKETFNHFLKKVYNEDDFASRLDIDSSMDDQDAVVAIIEYLDTDEVVIRIEKELDEFAKKLKVFLEQKDIDFGSIAHAASEINRQDLEGNLDNITIVNILLSRIFER